jgi:CHAT domain-containing protein
MPTTGVIMRAWLTLVVVWTWGAAQVLGVAPPVGPARPVTAEDRTREARRLASQGKWTEALAVAREALALARQARGERHPAYVSALVEVGSLMNATGDHARARMVLQQALALSRELYGERHPEVARALNNLVVVERNLGNLGGARVLAEQAVSLFRALVGERHPEYVNSLNNLAGVYKDLGEYARAGPLFEQALAQRRELLGEKHPDYLLSLNNLALLYLDMGDLARARPLLRRVLELTMQFEGERHPHFARRLNNLAVLEHRLGHLAEARALLERATQLTREVLGERHPDYANCLANLAALARDQGAIVRAFPLAEQALQIRRMVLGDRHPATIHSLHQMGVLYLAMEDLARARALLEQAAQGYREVIGPPSPHYARVLSDLAQVEMQAGNFARAVAHLRTALTAAHRHLEGAFQVLSTRQRYELLARTRHTLDAYLSAASVARLGAAEVYEEVLAWKGMVEARTLTERPDPDQPEAAPLVEHLRRTRTALAQLAMQPPDDARRADWRARLAQLQEAAESVERELARRLPRRRERSTPALVARALPARTAMVDLFEYSHATADPRNKGKLITDRRLLAFVILPGKEPAHIDLGPAGTIAEAVAAWRKPFTAEKPEPMDEKAAQTLRKIVWEPLGRHLKDIDTVLLSPDGPLCALPWSALPGSKEGTYLIEEFAIAQVTSHQFLSRAEKPPAGGGLVVVGGLDYGKAEPARPGARPAWKPLPATGREAERVAELFRKQSPKGRVVDLKGEGGTKERLAESLSEKKEENRCRYLHLATHGYFERPKAKAGEEPRHEYNPLLFAAVVLSGANKNPENGILTAEEVVSLNLPGCELAVLHADDTALGVVMAGEGVLGLVRAFHNAGARSVIASLGKVREEDRGLIERFYENLWAKKMTRLAALRAAQLHVLNHPGKDGKSHPARWAHLVLSGDTGAVSPP